MKKAFVWTVMIFMLLLVFSSIGTAHESTRHFREMEKVLFGNKAAAITGNSNKKKLIHHLEFATSLAIDQFSGSSNTYLLDLQQYGVPGLPANVTDTIDQNGINFISSGQSHRSYTHLGWSYIYDTAHREANWEKRREIMVNTVMKVLNSKDKELCDSFAALLYYVHIIGDVQEDSRRIDRENVIPLIEKHGLSDILHYIPNRDVFIELYHYLPLVFKGQVSRTYESYYNRMMSEIKALHSEVKQQMDSNRKAKMDQTDNNLTEDQLDTYTNNLLTILAENMPVLLEHSLFAGIFY